MKISDINFKKGDGLVPVIIQHVYTMQVLMLGYMDKAAYRKTKKEKQVTFYSRSKKRLWTKGESSGNYLVVKDINLDCDQDTLLIKAEPMGPTCHTGAASCFQEKAPKKAPKKTPKKASNKKNSKLTEQLYKGYIYQLQQIINQRIYEKDPNSYTHKLYKKGINKVAQKVGEEAVELVIEAIDKNLDLFKDEAADLLYHLLVLLKTMNVSLEEIEGVLAERSKKS